MIFALSPRSVSLRGTGGIERRLRILKNFIQLCSDEALGRNLAHGRVPQSTFGWSGTSKGSSVLPDYATLSMRFLKRKEDTSVMTFVRQSGDKDMELCFSA